MRCPKCDAVSKPIRDVSACREAGTQDLVVPKESRSYLTPMWISMRRSSFR
jgi:hypothetical protein